MTEVTEVRMEWKLHTACFMAEDEVVGVWKLDSS